MSSDQTELLASPPQFHFLPPTASAEPAGFGGGTPIQALCSGSLPQTSRLWGNEHGCGHGEWSQCWVHRFLGWASERWARLPISEGSSGKWRV